MIKLGRVFIFGLLALSSLTAEAQLVDPTAPTEDTGSVMANANINGLALSAIMISGDEKSAIINGQLLQVGGKIGGYKVTEINAQVVILQAPNNKPITLQLLTDTIKQPAASSTSSSAPRQ